MSRKAEQGHVNSNVVALIGVALGIFDPHLSTKVKKNPIFTSKRLRMSRPNLLPLTLHSPFLSEDFHEQNKNVNGCETEIKYQRHVTNLGHWFSLLFMLLVLVVLIYLFHKTVQICLP